MSNSTRNEKYTTCGLQWCTSTMSPLTRSALLQLRPYLAPLVGYPICCTQVFLGAVACIEDQGTWCKFPDLTSRFASIASAPTAQATVNDEGNLKQNLALLEKWGMTPHGHKWLLAQEPHMGLDSIETGELSVRLRWLVDELRCGEESVVRIVQSHPPFLKCLLEEEVAPFLRMFMSEGNIPKDLVRRMVLRYPPVIGCSKQFESSLAYLKGVIGISRAMWLKAVSKHPSVMRYSISETVKPMVDGLLSCGFSVENILEMVVDYPYVLGMSTENDLRPRLQCLENLGVTKENSNLILKQAPYLINAPERSAIPEKLNWLTSELGFESESALKFLSQYPRVFINALQDWQQNYELCVSIGMSREDFRQCLENSPYFMCWARESLKEKHEYARDVLKKTLKDIVEYPDYFRYSLENRIMLRVALMDSMDKDYTKPALRNLLSPSRANFIRRHGKKYPPNAIESFEDKWSKLSLEDKKKMIREKSYWKPPA